MYRKRFSLATKFAKFARCVAGLRLLIVFPWRRSWTKLVEENAKFPHIFQSPSRKTPPGEK